MPRSFFPLALLGLACSSSTTSRTLFAEADSGSGGSGSLTGHDAGKLGSGGALSDSGGPDTPLPGEGGKGDAPQPDTCLEGCRELCLTRWPAAPYPCWDRPVSTGSALCTCAYDAWREATEGCYGVIDPTVHLPRSGLCQ